MLFGAVGDGMSALEARWAGDTHRIELGERLEYSGPRFCATIDPAGFKVEHIEPVMNAADGTTLSLVPCATMYTLLTGLAGSMPYLPAAPGSGEGCIPHPAYEEQE
jgi:hypothetical protein